MPVGRKLDVGPIVLDFELINGLLAQHETTCETPACYHRDGGPEPAWYYYQTTWSFAWVGQGCYEYAQTLSGVRRDKYDRELAEHMMELLLVRSYAHQNRKSGFLLERSIAARDKIEKEIKRLEKHDAGLERRELRKAIADSHIKVGAPDDELLVARQRQDLRVRLGKPMIGRPVTDRAASLRAKLIVPSIFQSPTKKEGE